MSLEEFYFVQSQLSGSSGLVLCRNLCFGAGGRETEYMLIIEQIGGAEETNQEKV